MNYEKLEPYISRKTMHFHFDKHYQGYIRKLEGLIKDTPYEKMTLDQIITSKNVDNIKILQNANQVYNHWFFFQYLKKDVKMPQQFIELINSQFGSVFDFKDQIKNKILNHFSNGWVWVAIYNNGIHRKLVIVDTHDDETLFKYKYYKPLFVIDIWEHAYYLDTQNDRAKYFENIWKCIDWQRIFNENLINI